MLESQPSSRFDYLDQLQFRKIYCDPQSHTVMKFYIDGMKCAKCVQKIESLSFQMSHLKNVTVDLSQQVATVQLNTSRDLFSNVGAAIEALGFKAQAIPWAEKGQEEWNKAARKQLLRLGVAGFFATNIMTFALATYFGNTQDLEPLFRWIQFFLYLPVVTYVAFPFYKGFYHGLKSGDLTIDGPMAIASFSGFIVSTINLIQGRSTIYFDSLSGFLFLILLTRFWQSRTRHKYLRYLRPSALFESLRSRKLLETQRVDHFEGRQQDSGSKLNWKWIPTDHLKKGDQVLIEKNETLPCDGFLQSNSATLDLSVLNGEALPHKVLFNSSVKAGSKLLSETAIVKVEAIGSETSLGKILDCIRSESIQNLESVKQADRVSKWLLGIVYSIAFGILIFGFYKGSFVEYFERAFALIILACPCALAFGTPLVFSFSMKKSQQLGIIVKSLTFFERLKNVQTVFLDKTGTLTENEWVLKESKLTNENVDSLSFCESLVYSLEAQSQHPIGFAIRNILSQKNPQILHIQNGIEIPQQGLQGEFENCLYQIKGFSSEKNKKLFGLFKLEKNQSHLIWSFALEPQIKKSSRDLIKYLHSKNFQTFLISGDHSSEVDQMGQILGIDPKNCLALLTPEQKKEIVLKYPQSLMIGDGYNDSLALKSSSVSIAAFGGVDAALKSADAFFVKGGFENVPGLFELAAKSQRQVRLNIQYAVIYNVIGGLMAAFGMVNPFVAAILMPISSGFILLMTWWGLR